MDGLLKDPANYQSMNPDDFGRSHVLVLGKHSGSNGVITAYAELDIDINKGEALLLLPYVRNFVTRNKRVPKRDDLLQFYESIQFELAREEA